MANHTNGWNNQRPYPITQCISRFWALKHTDIANIFMFYLPSHILRPSKGWLSQVHFGLEKS